MLVWLVLISPLPTFAYELPDLGRPSAKVFTAKDERKLGREFMQEIRRSVTVVKDPIINDYVQRLGQRLVKSSSAPGKSFHFFVVKDQQINAFAGPEGHIGVNSGLVLATASESELAAVLSHEIAHVTQHHLERSLEQVHDLNIPVTAATVAALLLGTQVKDAATSSAAAGAAVSIMAGGTQHMINFTRANEAEADRIGMETLHRSGFDPKAMPRFFGRLQQMELDYGDQTPSFLRSHPVSADRIADAENRAVMYGVRGARENSDTLLDYLLVRARLQIVVQPVAPRRGVTSPKLKGWKMHVSKSDNPDPPYAPVWQAQQYAYALSLIEDRQLSMANGVLDNLIKINRHESIYYMAKAQLEMADHRSEEALAVLRTAYALDPTYRPLALEYAALLTRLHRPQAARAILQQQTARASAGDLPEANYALLAEAAAASGDLPNAYFYRAKALVVLGTPDAVRQARALLQQALQLPNLTTNMKAALQEELMALQESAKEQR